MTEIKAGYKKTDIGVIPEDWDVNLLYKLGKTYGGLSGKTKVDFGYGEDFYIPFMNIMNNVVIDKNFLEKICLSRKETQQKTKVSDLFFNSSSETPEEVGMCSLLTNDIKDLYLNSFCFGFRLNDLEKIDGLWLSYLFRSFFGRKLIYSLAQGSTRYNLSKSNFLKLKIPLPKPEEQKAIAAALSDVDGLIESLSQLIAKKRDMKTAAMQQLLTGKKRLPGFDGEWEELTLGDVCSEISDGTHYTPTYVSEGVPFYSVENVTANDFTNVKYITQAEHSLLIKRCRPAKGDILLTRIGSIGDTKLIDWDVDASIYVSLALLKTNQKAEAAYVYEYTKSSFFIKDIEARSLLNATPKKINMGDIKGVPIKCPKSRDEQLEIATFLSDMRAEIDALEQRLEKGRSLKTGMMQELLTGKTRLIKTNKTNKKQE